MKIIFSDCKVWRRVLCNMYIAKTELLYTWDSQNVKWIKNKQP